MKAEVVTELIISAVGVALIVVVGFIVVEAFFSHDLSGGGEGTFNDLVDAVRMISTSNSVPVNVLSRLGKGEFIVGKDAVWDEGGVVAFGSQTDAGSVIKFSLVYPACNSRACLCIWNSQDFTKRPVKCEVFESLAGFSWVGSGELNKGNWKEGSSSYLVLSGGSTQHIWLNKNEMRFVLVGN